MYPARADHASHERYDDPRPSISGSDDSAPLGQRRHRYARWGLHQGFAPGDGVVLLMRNQPDVLEIWQGLGALGLRVSLLDPRLRGPALAAALDRAGPRQLICDAGLAEALCSIQGHVTAHPVVWWHGAPADFARIDLEVAEYDDAPLADREIADAAASR